MKPHLHDPETMMMIMAEVVEAPPLAAVLCSRTRMAWRVLVDSNTCTQGQGRVEDPKAKSLSLSKVNN